MLISIGQIFDQTWETYREHFLPMLKISALLLIITVFEIIALVFYPQASTLILQAEFTSLETIGLVLYIFAKFVVSPIVGTWVFYALLKYVKQVYDNRKTNYVKALMDVKPIFWSGFLIIILVNLVLFGATLIGILPAILYPLSTFLPPIFTLVTLLLSLASIIVSFVLFMRWFIYFSFASYALTEDGKKGLAALRESKRLVQGKYWQVLGHSLIPMLAFGIIFLFIGTIIVGVSDLFISSAAGLNADIYARLSFISITFFVQLVFIFAQPIFIIILLLIYRSLKANHKQMRIS